MGKKKMINDMGVIGQEFINQMLRHEYFQKKYSWIHVFCIGQEVKCCIEDGDCPLWNDGPYVDHMDARTENLLALDVVMNIHAISNDEMELRRIAAKALEFTAAKYMQLALATGGMCMDDFFAFVRQGICDEVFVAENCKTEARTYYENMAAQCMLYRRQLLAGKKQFDRPLKEMRNLYEPQIL